MSLLESRELTVDHSRTRFQNVAGSFQNLHLSLDLVEMLDHLLVLSVLFTQVGGILSEVISLQILAALGLLVVVFFIFQGLFKLQFLLLELLDVVLLLLLSLGNILSLSSINSELVFGVIRLDLALKQLTLLGESLGICGQTLQLSLSCGWLLEDHFETLKSLFFVLELTANDLVVDFSVLTSLVSQVVEHLLWAQVIPSDFLCVHEALPD